MFLFSFSSFFVLFLPLLLFFYCNTFSSLYSILFLPFFSSSSLFSSPSSSTFSIQLFLPPSPLPLPHISSSPLVLLSLYALLFVQTVLPTFPGSHLQRNYIHPRVVFETKIHLLFNQVQGNDQLPLLCATIFPFHCKLYSKTRSDIEIPANFLLRNFLFLN